MANTFTQLYCHVVFAVKGRACLIRPGWKEELYKYITGIVTAKGQKLLAINGMPDHLHLLVGTKPNMALSDLVREIKASSSRFIRGKGWVRGAFEWQEGFGAFILWHFQLSKIIPYIQNQEEHHRVHNFWEEYMAFLQKYEVEYRPEYMFQEVN